MKKWPLILLIILVLISCEDQKFSTVNVSATWNHRLFDYPRISGPSGDCYQTRFGDGKTTLDSVPNGKMTITIFSLLTKDIEKTVKLQRDTLISFDNDIYPNITKVNGRISTDTWNINDTIFVGRESLGCFHHYFEKIVLFKKQNKLQVEYSNTSSLFYPNIYKQTLVKDTLYTLYLKKFIRDCINLYNEPLEKYNYSTTSLTTYIRKGNAYYELPDINEWKGFEDFKVNLGITMFRM